MKALFLAVPVLVGALVSSPARAETWKIDPVHSDAYFLVRHLMITDVRGNFSKLEGTVDYDEKDPVKSSVNVTIDTSTIDTHEAKRDEHLKSPDFLDTAKYPTATFKSTKITKGKKGMLNVTGDLTLHGVTKPVTLEVEGPTKAIKDPMGSARRGVHATATINRKDFGLQWNKAVETGGIAVGWDVKLVFDLELVPAAAPEPKKS